ncbi:type IV toxin-antitoxin system AbiEi family antitoxin domain-containing protein [Pseudarthrobacter sp. N5]|uniref:type IV toxin-antitoxin system AbiEi family antitoxin domain-containing protein n=1 Tax=Pseudarthrobacter sp. N5 TaxID=3418416 RepID=UPI003CEC0C41
MRWSDSAAAVISAAASGTSRRHRKRSVQLILAHAHGTLTTSTGAFAYSHISAARLCSLYLWDVPDTVHITQQTHPATSTHGAGVAAHTRKLAPGDLATVNGLPCTSLERTVVDCCLLLNYRQSLILMDHALRLGADEDNLREACARLAGRNGVKTLRRVLDTADARSESAGETLCRELLSRLNIKAPTLQMEVRTSAGLHRMDFGWKEERVALEFDGRTKYFDYAPTDQVLFEERNREKALTNEGWRVIRIGWKHLFREQEFKTLILQALRNQAAR